MAGDVVVLVDGLWTNGLEFGVLGHRLRSEHGFDVRTFSYPTLHGDVGSICAGLADFAEREAGGRRVHFVGHSLGGVLVYRTLSECGAGRLSGNAVLLGSPLNGSRAARGFLRYPVPAVILPAGNRAEEKKIQFFSGWKEIVFLVYNNYCKIMEWLSPLVIAKETTIILKNA